MSKSEQAKELVAEAFIEIVNHKRCDEETMSRYLSRDYLHYADGNVKNYDDFINHFDKQFQEFQKMEIKFLDMVAEDNKVFTIHTLDVMLKNGERNLWQGHALFYIENNKIIRSFELTHLIMNPDRDKLLAYFSKEN